MKSQRRKAAKGTLSRLMGYVGRRPLPLAGVFLCALVGNTALQLAPRLVGEAIDLILPAPGNDFFPALLRILAVIAAFHIGLASGGAATGSRSGSFSVISRLGWRNTWYDAAAYRWR